MIVILIGADLFYQGLTPRQAHGTHSSGMDSIEAEFGENQSLYDVLGLQPTATPAEIKKAYFKVALKCVSK